MGKQGEELDSRRHVFYCDLNLAIVGSIKLSETLVNVFPFLILTKWP